MSEFWRTVLLLCLGGALGGLLYCASQYATKLDAYRPIGLRTTWRNILAFCGINAFLGIGGAWAACLAMLWAKRLPLADGVDDLLELLSTSLVAGYAGNRLLPAVADRLTRELLERTATTTVNAANDAAKSRTISEVIAYMDATGSQTDHQTDAYEKILKDYLADDSLFRQAAILLARLYAELKQDYTDAVAVLEAFIDAKRKAGAGTDENVADAAWNLANYYELLYKANPSTSDFRQKAVAWITESIRIVPAYKNNLREDEDFAALRADPAVAALLK